MATSLLLILRDEKAFWIASITEPASMIAPSTIASGDSLSMATFTTWKPLPLPRSLSSTTFTELEPISRPTRFFGLEKNTGDTPYPPAFWTLAYLVRPLSIRTKFQYIPQVQFCKSALHKRQITGQY